MGFGCVQNEAIGGTLLMTKTKVWIGMTLESWPCDKPEPPVRISPVFQRNHRFEGYAECCWWIHPFAKEKNKRDIVGCQQRVGVPESVS